MTCVMVIISVTNIFELNGCINIKNLLGRVNGFDIYINAPEDNSVTILPYYNSSLFNEVLH